MKIQLKVVKDSPVQAYRHYEILREGEPVGTFHKGRDGRWTAQLIRNPDQPWSAGNRTAYAHSSYHAMVRLIACHLLGEVDRLPYLARGIWTNPCPTPEVMS